MPRKLAVAIGATLVAWGTLAVLLPSGLPAGIVLLGVVLGALGALTAMGLVLVYRATRIINFAQAEIGGLAAAVAVIMVVGYKLPYAAALPVGLVAAIATGALVDLIVVRRFFSAPRLILTVATIGLAQLLAGASVQLPKAFAHLSPLTSFKTQLNVHFTVSPVVFNGDHAIAMAAVAAALAGLWFFLARTDTGIAIRGAGESAERTLLLGVPIRRLSTITWAIAAGLSGIGAMLSAPILGPSLGTLAGPEVLFAPLVAAVVAGFESLPVAFAASIGIGVAEQAVFWSYPRSSAIDLALFGLVLVALLLKRRHAGRADDEALGASVSVRSVRPIPAALGRRREVRAARLVIAILGAGVLILPPLGLSQSRLILAAFMLIYAIIAVSLVVLTGWAGQVSLGQFAFVGLGAAATGSLLVHAGADLFVALLASAALGGAAAALIGLPALRIRGLMLAATTLAFAVPVSTFFLNSAYFPSFTPRDVGRPAVLGRFDLNAPRTFYYFCLFVLVVAVVLARNFRRSRVGRTILAVRDNERAAAAFSISPVRAKLTAFVFSGALAGLAGGLFVLGTRGIGFSGFSPEASFQVFTMVVVGGLGSLSGALLGAAYVEGVQFFLRGGAQLLATGTGLLALLMVVPGGLGEVLYNVRDALLRRLARARGIDAPALLRAEEKQAEPEERTAPASRVEALLRCERIDAGYGKLQVLFGVDVELADREMIALLGTNGAGKSTLLKVAAGLIRPRSGRVLLDGADVTALDPVARVKAGVVMVPGGRGVLGSLTVAENLRLAGWLMRRDRAALVRAQDDVFGLFPILRDRLRERASSLSGGEQQMLTLAQALLCRPRVLMIDELSLGLAPTVVSALLDVVRTLNAGGVSVVLVEQSLNIATSVARRAVFMDRGEVRFTGEREDLLERSELVRAVFLRPSAPPAPTRAGDGHRPVSGDGRPRLETAGVVVRFGGVVAVDGVDLRAGPGEILGLIGANGAGKTSLFDACSGFLRPEAGRILLDGNDITGLTPWERAELGIGRSAQDARLFPSMTVAEALATALERHIEVREPVACTLRVGATIDSEQAAAERVAELLERMGLAPYRDLFVSELSTGMRRVLDLACALAHEPDVMLLDEPSTGLAQRETEMLGGLLLRLRDETGATLVVVEHDVPLVSQIADELACMHLGRVIARGAPSKVLEDPAVVAAYLGTDEAAIARSGPGQKRRGPAQTRRRRR